MWISTGSDVKSHFILKGESLACWLTPASMQQQELTPAGGRASYSILLHFAGLTHPNIAALLDGGVAAEGRPFW